MQSGTIFIYNDYDVKEGPYYIEQNFYKPINKDPHIIAASRWVLEKRELRIDFLLFLNKEQIDHRIKCKDDIAIETQRLEYIKQVNWIRVMKTIERELEKKDYDKMTCCTHIPSKIMERFGWHHTHGAVRRGVFFIPNLFMGTLFRVFAPYKTKSSHFDEYYKNE